MPEFDPGPLLAKLVEHRVRFVVIGGLAGMAHGSSYPTFDVDVAYARDRDNLEHLAAALRDLGATLRGGPPDLPFALDAKTLASGASFTFDTTAGPFDIVGDPAGAPAFGQLENAAVEATVEGVRIRVASLDHLIAMKEAAGRPKDKLMASEYRAISDELRAPHGEE